MDRAKAVGRQKVEVELQGTALSGLHGDPGQ